MNHKGISLIEILAVVGIIGLLAAVSGVSFDNIAFWREGESVRRFASTFEVLYYESQVNKKSYRLNINLDKNSYFVVEEIPQIQTGSVDNFDSVAGLRTKSERERRANKDREEYKSIDERINEQIEREQSSLELQFVETAIASRGSNVELGRPVAFPSLFEETSLPAGVTFLEFENIEKRFTEGTHFFRFSPQGAVSLATIKVKLSSEQIVTIIMDPFLGEVLIEEGEKKISELIGAFE